jgi:hypothetical protein
MNQVQIEWLWKNGNGINSKAFTDRSGSGYKAINQTIIVILNRVRNVLPYHFAGKNNLIDM